MATETIKHVPQHTNPVSSVSDEEDNRSGDSPDYVVPTEPAPPMDENQYADNRLQRQRFLHFLETAPLNWEPGTSVKKFHLFDEVICCVLWEGKFHITGTDIVKSLVWRFRLDGQTIGDRKKFEEGVFSDLRNLKPGIDATLEEPRSKFLDFLYKLNCIRTHKKQKVFYWYSVPHEKLFQDALRREKKREIYPIVDTLLSLGFEAPRADPRILDKQMPVRFIEAKNVPPIAANGAQLRRPLTPKEEMGQKGAIIRPGPQPMQPIAPKITIHEYDTAPLPLAASNILHPPTLSFPQVQPPQQFQQHTFVPFTPGGQRMNFGQPPPAHYPHHPGDSQPVADSNAALLLLPSPGKSAVPMPAPSAGVSAALLIAADSVAENSGLPSPTGGAVVPTSSSAGHPSGYTVPSLSPSGAAAVKHKEERELDQVPSEPSDSIKRQDIAVPAKEPTEEASQEEEASDDSYISDDVHMEDEDDESYSHDTGSPSSVPSPSSSRQDSHDVVPHSRSVKSARHSMAQSSPHVSQMATGASTDKHRKMPYVCSHPLCRREFKRYQHLKRHQLTHSGEKPYRCPEPNCVKSFARSDNLAQHVRIHTQNRS